MKISVSMIQGIIGLQIELSKFVGYGGGGLGVRVMSSEQLRRFFSRHEIAVRHHAGNHPSPIADSDGFATLNFGQKFGKMRGHIRGG